MTKRQLSVRYKKAKNREQAVQNRGNNIVKNEKME